MNRFSLILAIACPVTLVTASLHAQEVDNTQTLPQAQPGECYAKVITPARFETRSEEVVVREASERIEAVPAVYADVEEQVLVKDESRNIESVEAVFEPNDKQIETRPAETRWTQARGDVLQPVSPDVLAGLSASDIELDAVEANTCFDEYYTDATYVEEPREVLTRDESERVVVSEAVYETVTERVLIREASSEVIDVPAVYRIETQSVLVEPARSVWKQGRGLVERIDNTTGEILCLIEVPARYETITKTVLDKPATTKTVTVPAEYESYEVQRLARPASEQRDIVPAEHTTVQVSRKTADPGFFWQEAGTEASAEAIASGRQVCLTEFPAEYETVAQQLLVSKATAKVEEVPAEYNTVTVQRLQSAATENRIPIPLRTRTVSSRVQTEPSKLEWRKVLCETNITPRIITDLQQALQDSGFDPGPIDGVLGQGTMSAVESYQLDNELDRGGLTYETLQELGLDT